MFDGQSYDGRLGLVPPIYAHPGAGHVGEGLAQALRASFQALRHGGRMVSHQTYPCYSRRLRSAATETVAIHAGAYVDVAQCTASIPYWATHCVARLHGRISTIEPVDVSCRIVVTDGVSTDTGTATVLTLDVQGVPWPNQAVFSLWMPGDPSCFQIDCAVALVNARVTPGPLADRTVRVEAFAEGALSPQGMQPYLVEVGWRSHG